MSYPRDKHYILKGDYSVKIVKDKLNGISGYDWTVYRGNQSSGPFVASSFCIGTLAKAKKEAMQGLGTYLASIRPY